MKLSRDRPTLPSKVLPKSLSLPVRVVMRRELEGMRVREGLIEKVLWRHPVSLSTPTLSQPLTYHLGLGLLGLLRRQGL